MKKNYSVSFKIDGELLNLIDEVLKKVNDETNIIISKSDFIRIAVKRICMEIKGGEIKSTEFLFKK